MKKIINLILFLFISLSVKAQIKLQLNLLSDNKTYVVSMIPEVTWSYPLSITGTAQVTLKYPMSKKLMVTNLRSLVPNVQWHDNAYIEASQTSGGFSFVSFALRSQGTSAIPYEAGREVPLFSFINYYGCIGQIELVNNAAPNLSGEEARIYNIGNHWTTLANQTEAYKGNVQATANCSTATSTADNGDKLFSAISAYPLPASDRLTLKINAKTADVQKINQIQFINSLGQVVLTQKIKVQEGEQELTVDVTSLTTGLYLFQLKGEQVASQKYKFIISEN
ncbi:MAG: T9SS type A sorting domain-containing protein [Saprospiraceae bacterium]|nr:T9SS type A sorting domain-containing protein [Saprospiraceae bacterium]